MNVRVVGRMWSELKVWVVFTPFVVNKLNWNIFWLYLTSLLSSLINRIIPILMTGNQWLYPYARFSHTTIISKMFTIKSFDPDYPTKKNETRKSSTNEMVMAQHVSLPRLAINLRRTNLCNIMIHMAVWQTRKCSPYGSSFYRKFSIRKKVL